MTLRIGTLDTHCSAPRGLEQAAELVDTVARRLLSRELLERLGPTLGRQPAVVRLRRLNCTLRIDAADMKRGGLPAAWADAMARALHQALARPDLDGEMLQRFESRAAYFAAMIATASRGPSDGNSWRFPELHAQAGRHPAIAVLDLLFGAGSLLGEVLEELRGAGDVARVLALLDEVGLERVLRVIAEAQGGDAELSVAQFVAVAAALVGMGVPPGGSEAASRRRAIELWLHFKREPSVRGIWYATKLLARFLEEPALLHWGGRTDVSRSADDQHGGGLAAPLADIMSRFPEWCERLRRQLPGDRSGRAAAVLEALRPITPSAAPSPHGTAPLWLHLDHAGILLLLPVIQRLGWPKIFRDPGLGPRVFQALTAGAAMRLLRVWRPGEKVEPEAALLAGMFEEADRLGLAQVLSSTPPAALGLFPDRPAWPEALDAASDALATGLTAGIRGFRNAGRESIVRHFLRTPGRVLVGRTEIRILLESSPWSVALHISGADVPLPDVEFLGGRRAVFVLEGL